MTNQLSTAALMLTELADQATAVLDAQLELYRKAQKNFEENKGKIGEEKALEFGLKVHAEYKATMNAYALIGLSNLGIHNVKAAA